MNLLRNDPEMASQVIESALRGDMDAQFSAGLIYAEGRGVEVDLVQSWFWLTRAVEQGDCDAGRLRGIIGAQMSDDEFARARHLASVSPDGRPGGGRDASRPVRH